jgi:hypothetical protein
MSSYSDFSSDGVVRVRLDRAFEGSKQSRPLHAEFGAMVQGEFPKDLFPLGCEREQDLAAVFAATLAGYKTFCGQAIYEFDCAVMLNLQALGQFANPGTHPWRQAFQGEHQLMLVRLQAGGACDTFAEVEEASNLVAQFGQGLMVGLGFRVQHICIVSRYIDAELATEVAERLESRVLKFVKRGKVSL